MTARFDLVTFDAPSPDEFASFWSTVLGLVELEREDGDRWIVLGSPEGSRRIGVQRGAVRPGSVHLDLRCALDEFDDEVERVVRAGARLAAPVRTEPYGRIANLLDPLGQPFDLCAYD